MRWHSRIVLGGLLLASFPILSVAQNDICFPSGRAEQGDQARAEQLRIQSAERNQREAERRSWEIKMFPVKNPINVGVFGGSNFDALCIFRIEVVLQPGLKLVQVRAPKELMPTIEEALKTLDVPPPPPTAPKPPRGVELTAYVLVAAERALNPSWMPVPRELESVARELKSILTSDSLFLADAVVARGIEERTLGVTGATSFNAAKIQIRDGAIPVVRLENLNVTSNGAGFNTSIDVPVGTQVVVGRSTASQNRPVFLVITAKLLN